MTIVQVIPMFGFACAEIMCENLIYELINLGHSVTVISMYYYKSAITDRLEKRWIFDIWARKRLRFINDS